MTGILASVCNRQEAMTALQAQVDIIDLKEPRNGALGALAFEEIHSITATIANNVPVSATIGDLPMIPEHIHAAVSQVAQCGVDYIKIGLFANGDIPASLAALTSLARQHKLIAVMFADTPIDFSLIPLLATSGFSGVMLDTCNKQNGSLTEIMSIASLTKFVKHVKYHSLLCGLAGSLRVGDISTLYPLQANYLGFRSALCQQQTRTNSLDKQAILRLQEQLTASRKTALTAYC